MATESRFGNVVSKLLSLAGYSLALIFVIVVVRTFTLNSRTILAPKCDEKDSDFIKASKSVIDNFVRAIKCRTVFDSGTLQGKRNYTTELENYHELIRKAYPTIHTSPLVTVETINKHSLLYTVKGTNATLKPYMLMAHLDVVPATSENWDVPPFEGRIQDGFIYGRGTIDHKQGVMGILEALEFLLRRGHKPNRSFFVGFGHDEEVGGAEGAYHIGQTLGKRGVKLEFLMDEGLTITDGVVMGVDKPVALIGTSEKGYIDLRLTVNTTGGHSSMPRKDSAITILANAVARLESHQQTSMFGYGPEKGLFEQLAPEMSLPFRAVMSNLWLFSPLVAMIMSQKPEMNAMSRTTTAITEFHGGVKSNVIAPSAWATVNHRVHPAQTVQEVLDHDKRVINDDRVKIEVIRQMEALPKSPYNATAFGYHSVKTSIRQVWGHKGTIVAPGLMIGNTDTRHYTHLTKNIYRFSPTYMFPEDLARFHGFNERISVKNYEEAINFFYHLMMNADNEKLDPMHVHGEL